MIGWRPLTWSQLSRLRVVARSMDILFIVGALIIGVGIGISLTGKETLERPCNCQCHCAAPVAERDGSLSLRDLSLVLIFSVTLVIGVCTFLFVQSLHRLPPSPKGKGRKGVFGAPLHLRDKELWTPETSVTWTMENILPRSIWDSWAAWSLETPGPS